MTLEVQLTQLETAQLVRHIGEEQATYMFKHVLTQEAAYQSLLVKQRREIHRTVAQAYEQIFADRCMDEYAAILVQHYAEAGDDAQTMRYAIHAGDVAARTYANAEAILFYTQAIDIAKRASGAPLKELYLKRGRVHEVNDAHDRALANYEEMESLARERDDQAMQVAALCARATIYSIPSSHFDQPRAQTLSETALALAREIGDRPAQAKILWNMVLFNSRLASNHRQAMEYGEQAVAIARELDLREQLAYLLNDLSLVYVWGGDPERGTRYNLEARAMWRTMNNLPMLVDNLNYAIMQHIALGEHPQALAASRESSEISRRIGNVWGEAFNLSWIGEVYRDLGHIDQAIAAMEESIRLGAHSFQAPLSFTRADLAALYADLGQVARGKELALLARVAGAKLAHVMEVYASSQLAHVYLLEGDLASAQATVHQAVQTLTPTDTDSMFAVALYAADAEVALAQKDYARTIQTCDRLIEHTRVRHLIQFLAGTLYFKGCALYRQAKLDDAFACLAEARAEAERIDSCWTLWRILLTLAEIENERGNYEQAGALRAQAREIIAFIVEHTPTELRASFLNVPDVRALMNAG